MNSAARQSPPGRSARPGPGVRSSTTSSRQRLSTSGSSPNRSRSGCTTGNACTGSTLVSSDQGPAGDRGRVRGAVEARDAYLWTVESTVYVDHECHRRGVGDALYAELLARLERQGFRTSIGVIALPNPASVRLHERHGFVQVGLLADAGYKLKRWHDVGFGSAASTAASRRRPRSRRSTTTDEECDGLGRVGIWRGSRSANGPARMRTHLRAQD